METIYPDDDEIEFRESKSGGIESISNDKIKCTICKNELMNEIVLKKMIMVDRIHLVMCCYNCFYKLCDGNEFSCILCKSSKELSNCEKCYFNVCERCIEIHEIDKVSNSVLTKCFGCQPQMLWKQRAQTFNVLKVFSSQLDMPNGLLVNDIEREQTVRTYLIKEAKNGQNTRIDNIKDQLCLDFLLSSYKSTVIEKVTTFSPNNGNNISIDEHLNQFIQLCENVVENTFSALTSIKRIFHFNSQLNPKVFAMMKFLLKTVDKGKNVLSHSKINENPINLKEINTANQSPNLCNTRSSRSNKKKNVNRCNLKSSVNMQPSINQVDKDVRECLDDSILTDKMGNMSSNVNIDMEIDEIIPPLNLSNDSSHSEKENTRKLKSCKVIKIDEKKQKTQFEKSKKNKNIVKSDDEKKIYGLIKLNNIEKQSKKKTIIDKSCADNDGNIDSDNIDTEPENNIDVENIDSDRSETSFTNENGDITVNEVINKCCLTVCNGDGIKNYPKKNQDNQLNMNCMKTIDMLDEMRNLEKSDVSSLSDDSDTPMAICPKRSPTKMSSTSNESESYSQSEKIVNGTKRKRSTSMSSNSSDLPSHYLKDYDIYNNHSPMLYIISPSENSGRSSDEDPIPAPVKKHGKLKPNDKSDEDSKDSSDRSYKFYYKFSTSLGTKFIPKEEKN